MSDDQRCELTDLLVESCAHCHPNPDMEQLIERATRPHGSVGSLNQITAAGKKQSVQTYEQQSLLQATMNDRCLACLGPIKVGDWVRVSTNHNYGWIHRACV